MKKPKKKPARKRKTAAQRRMEEKAILADLILVIGGVVPERYR